jgi:hypothetical protein
MTAPSPRTFFEIVAFLVLLQVLARFEDRHQAMNQIVILVAILMVVAWIAFAVWYLRAGVVSPAAQSWNNSAWKGRAFRLWESRLPDPYPRDLAVTAILRGRLSRTLTKSSVLRESVSASIISGAAMIGVGYLIGAVVSHDDVTLPFPIELAIVIGGGVGIGIGVHQMASRARLLWLLCGAERLAVFRLLEIEALKLVAVAIVIVTLLFTGLQLSGAAIGLRNGILVPSRRFSFR